MAKSSDLYWPGGKGGGGNRRSGAGRPVALPHVKTDAWCTSCRRYHSLGEHELHMPAPSSSSLTEATELATAPGSAVLVLPDFSLLARQPKIPHVARAVARRYLENEHGVVYTVEVRQSRSGKDWWVSASSGGLRASNTLHTSKESVGRGWARAVESGAIRIEGLSSLSPADSPGPSTSMSPGSRPPRPIHEIRAVPALRSARELEAEAREIASTISPVGHVSHVNPYEERQARRRASLERGAARASSESERALGAARRIGDAIPFGQPILVGHHSERRHRRDVEKIDRSMRKGVEEAKRAEELARRAAAVGTGGVSQDDPEAIRKLKEELAALRGSQELMVRANKAIRAHGGDGEDAVISALVAVGLKEATARKILQPDFAGRVGFADYALKNNGANIRRIEKRVDELARKAAAPARLPVTGEADGLSFVLSENKESNRTQVAFSGKPGESLRGRFKSRGFRFSPSAGPDGAWQRHLSNGAWYDASVILGLDPVTGRPK